MRIERFQQRHARPVIHHPLSDPEELVQYAVANERAFRPVDFNTLPDRPAPPAALVNALAEFFAQNIRRRFDASRAVPSKLRAGRPEAQHPSVDAVPVQ